MSQKYYFDPATPLGRVVDRDGDLVFSQPMIDKLKMKGFSVLKDLFFSKSSESRLGLAEDPKAADALKVLDQAELVTNRLPYALEEVYKGWKYEQNTRQSRKRSQALASDSSSGMAKVGRASRITRSFAYIAPDEVGYLVRTDGKKCEVDRGAVGLSSNPDDFGYNG